MHVGCMYGSYTLMEDVWFYLLASKVLPGIMILTSFLTGPSPVPSEAPHENIPNTIWTEEF